MPPQSASRRAAKASKPRSASKPVLRQTVLKPAMYTPDPIDSAFIAGRLTTLTHELANLVDGSMRTLSLTLRAIDDKQAHGEGLSPEALSERLRIVRGALEHMAELLKASMSKFGAYEATPPWMIGSDLLSPAEEERRRWTTLGESARHAIAVMKPLADEKKIELRTSIAPEAERMWAGGGGSGGTEGQSGAGGIGGGVHAVIVNAIRNAIESIQRVPQHREGVIDVAAYLEHDDAKPSQQWVVLEVRDNGEGPPFWALNDSSLLFEFGVSTKRAKGSAAQGKSPGAVGIGLALCRELLRLMGGSINLRSAKLEGDTPGAILEARWPARKVEL